MSRNCKLERFKNQFEIELYKDLRRHQRKGKYKIGYETEKLRYTLERYYLPDFVLTRKDGSKIYIEGKGYFRADDRQKTLKIKEQYPGIDLRIVFYKNGKLDKRSKTRYSEWAERNGIPWAIQTIPIEWLS